MSAAGVELGLPGQQDAVAEAILQRFELGRELGVQERGDAVGLGVVDRPVEEQVGVGVRRWWPRSSPVIGS
nr:hypothetical protein [Microbacterium sp.]